MAAIFFLKDYINPEKRINRILIGKLSLTLLEEESPDCENEAKELVTLYFEDKACFEEKAKRYLQFQLELENEELLETVEKIKKVID